MMKILKIIFFSMLVFFAIDRVSIARVATVHQKHPSVELTSAILHPKGLLWKIEKSGLTPSYLYGTMHVGDPRVTTLAPVVERAFVAADQFVMEVVMNFQAMGYISSASFFNNGHSLDKVMTHAKYKKLVDLVNKRLSLSENALKNMKPWAVMMMLMMPVEQRLNASTALDMVLFKRASQRKIKVTGLETAEEQVAIFESMSMHDQLWLLNRAIDEIEITDAQMPNMLNAYVQRDLAELVNIQQQSMYQDSQIDDRFMEQLIDKRNIRMVERMQAALKQGNSFIAVGALHLPGKKGVLHLLEQQGYIVSAIY